MNKIYLTGIFLCWQSQALAFFDGEVFYGVRSSKVKYTLSDGTVKSKSVSGNDIGATFLLDPVPFVPIAFGVTARQGSTKIDKICDDILQDSFASFVSDGDTTTSSCKSSALAYGPVLKVWLPLPKVRPYMKAAYLMGADTDEVNLGYASSANSSFSATVDLSLKTVYERQETEVGLGIEVSPIKFSSLFVEYVIQSGSRKAKGLSGTSATDVNGTPTNTVFTDADLSSAQKKKETMTSGSVRLGLSVGI